MGDGKIGEMDIVAGDVSSIKMSDTIHNGSEVKQPAMLEDVGHPHASNVVKSVTTETNAGNSLTKAEHDLETVEEDNREIEELGASLATMHGHIEQEKQKKIEKEKRKQEKLKRQQRAIAEREAQEKKLARRNAKIKEAEEWKMQMRKEMKMEAAFVKSELREQLASGFPEQLTDEMLKALATASIDRKGKKKVASPPSPRPSSTSSDESNNTEPLNRRTRILTTKEKRKRNGEKAVGGNPPMMQPAKRTPRMTGVKPVRLAAKLQCTTTKTKEKKTPPRFTPRRGTPRTKIAALMGAEGRAKFICDNIRALADLGADELKETCRKEDVNYEKNTIAAMNIAKKRAVVAYGSEEDEVCSRANETDVVEQGSVDEPDDVEADA
ncbi:hypothetical protein CBR_g21149 [Chara braunii]|uniref:Uncharacterized protein n=1 Tax=Chara braunii TaxID=69332 RepID=A0A388L0T1_CHABU|nr:hypothetical protein CBR_g21149 [Chara braunii]|eukprot:GBG75907.1 hypothetical protein CBR_g21149 [Chara braunii]